MSPDHAATRTSFQLKFMFGAKIPFEIKEKTLDWRQGSRAKSVRLADVVGFGVTRMPKVFTPSTSGLFIAVATGGGNMTRYRVPVDPDDAETLALLAALSARLPSKDVRTMPAAYAAQLVPPPSPGSDWLNGHTVIGVCLVTAAFLTGGIGLLTTSSETSLEGGQHLGYGVAALVGVLVGAGLVFWGLRRARQARLAGGASETRD